MPSLHLWRFCYQLGTAREAGCGSVCSNCLCLGFPLVCDLPVEVAKLLEEGWNSGRQNVPWARESGLAVVNLLISMHWDLGNTPCLCSLTKLFPVVSLSSGDETGFPVGMGQKNITCFWRSFLPFCPECVFLARLKKSSQKNQMCKRYAAPSPSAGMSTGSSMTLWNSSGSVGSLQTQTTCSWETTWTEAITQWRQ